MKFDSIREFERYQELKLLETAGVISKLECQPVFKITVGGRPVMSKRRKGHQYEYRADFRYYDNEQDRVRIEDVKGYFTPLSVFKIAILEAETGTEVEIVR